MVQLRQQRHLREKLFLVLLPHEFHLQDLDGSLLARLLQHCAEHLAEVALTDLLLHFVVLQRVLFLHLDERLLTNGDSFEAVLCVVAPPAGLL